MGKALFINGPAEGHINPTLGLVAELLKRGEQVVYLAHEAFGDKIRKTGAHFRPFEAFTGTPGPEDRPDFLGMILFMLKSADERIERAVAVGKEEGASYVVHDAFFGWGSVVARRLGVPSISTHSTFAPVLTAGMSGTAGPGGSGGDGRLEEIMRRLARMAVSCGLPASAAPDVMFNKGDLNLVFTSEAFQPRRELFDATYAFVGPSIAGREEDTSVLPVFPRDRRLVYVSMGTMVEGGLGLYEACMEAWGDGACTLVLSTGRTGGLESWGELPSHVYHRPYVPLLEVLRRCDLFVTHGGMNSVSEALYHNVPLLVIPQKADQPLVAGRIQELGCGTVLQPGEVNAGSLRRAAAQVMEEDSIRSNVAALGRTLREAGGAARAADLVLQTAASGRF